MSVFWFLTLRFEFGFLVSFFFGSGASMGRMVVVG
jgi:hypothetical protein